MKQKAHWIFGALFVCAVLFLALWSQRLPPFSGKIHLNTDERLKGLTTIYEGAKESFAYWSLVPDLDWDGLYAEYQARVVNAPDPWSYYEELRRFTAHLRDGHTRVDMRLSPPCILPLELRYMEGQYIVWGAADNTSIPPGSVVATINGQDTGVFLEQRVGDQLGLFTANARQDVLCALARYSGAPDELTLEGVTPDGERFRNRVTYQTRFPRLRTLSIDAMGTPVDSYFGMKVYEHKNGVYRIVLPDFQQEKLPDEFKKFVEKYGDKASAFILDLRHNGGGNSLYGLQVLCHFSQPEDLTRVWNKKFGFAPSTKEYRMLMVEQSKQAGIRQEKLLSQPVVVLTDWYCASAGDDFAAYVKGCDRFTMIGTNTYGITGELKLYDLPARLQFGVSSNFIVWGEDNTPIINLGIPPDIWVEQTVADALQHKDTTLTFALEYIKKQ